MIRRVFFFIFFYESLLSGYFLLGMSTTDLTREKKTLIWEEYRDGVKTWWLVRVLEYSYTPALLDLARPGASLNRRGVLLWVAPNFHIKALAKLEGKGIQIRMEFECTLHPAPISYTTLSC